MVTGDLHAITVNYDHLFLYISPLTMDELHRIVRFFHFQTKIIWVQ